MTVDSGQGLHVAAIGDEGDAGCVGGLAVDFGIADEEGLVGTKVVMLQHFEEGLGCAYFSSSSLGPKLSWYAT